MLCIIPYIHFYLFVSFLYLNFLFIIWINYSINRLSITLNENDILSLLLSLFTVNGRLLLYCLSSIYYKVYSIISRDGPDLQICVVLELFTLCIGDKPALKCTSLFSYFLLALICLNCCLLYCVKSFFIYSTYYSLTILRSINLIASSSIAIIFGFTSIFICFYEC